MTTFFLAVGRSQKPPRLRLRGKTLPFKIKVPAQAGQLISKFLSDLNWVDGFVHVYTDGSCHSQQYPWLRRSGAGVHWAEDHPLNTRVHQGGQAHTSPRAELLAIVIAIEQARWPIHIFSDNQGYVIAVSKLLSGNHTSSIKDNTDLWSRVLHKLHRRQRFIKISWIKGHATQEDIQKGTSSLQHQIGNNAADLLANAGSAMIALPNLILQGHLLKRHIVIAIQAMLLACYTKRQEARQDSALETAIERQLEGEPTEGPSEASQNANLVAAMHVPLERTLTDLAAQRIKNAFPAYCWTNLDQPGAPLIPPNIPWPLGLARFRKPQWRFPIAILDHLIWYWSRIIFLRRTRAP